MKTVVVTGASGGLGVALAQRFAESGYQVIATVRDLKKVTPLDELIDDGAKIEKVELDVSSDASIKTFSDWLSPKGSGLDVLINNAGINFKSCCKPMPQSSPCIVCLL